MVPSYREKLHKYIIGIMAGLLQYFNVMDIDVYAYNKNLAPVFDPDYSPICIDDF